MYVQLVKVESRRGYEETLRIESILVPGEKSSGGIVMLLAHAMLGGMLGLLAFLLVSTQKINRNCRARSRTRRVGDRLYWK